MIFPDKSADLAGLYTSIFSFILELKLIQSLYKYLIFKDTTNRIIK
jgi:hypothetical protein